MPHVIERATSGRAKCRGCGGRIAAGAQRFGERLPNPYADDEAELTHWFHVPCAVFRRPEALLEALVTTQAPLDDRPQLEHEARLGVAHRRLPRVGAAERAASARATCRSCRETILKDAWRISLVYYEDGRFSPAGFVHVRCASAYFETRAVIARVRHFSPALTELELDQVRQELESPGSASAGAP
jgi:hypothetical protein